MVTNDRFIVSLACLYLAGKVADCPKSSSRVLSAGAHVLEGQARANDIARNREWLEAARKQLYKAERAILYHTGFRFNQMTVTEAVVHMLQDKPLHSFLQKHFTKADDMANFSQLCIQFCNQSTKTPLILQYSPETIAAGCIWMTMKLFKIDCTPIHQPTPWYIDFARGDQLADVSDQIILDILDEAEEYKG